jgi:hypothetical protein
MDVIATVRAISTTIPALQIREPIHARQQPFF